MDNGSLWDDFELSNSYRNEPRGYVQDCLGLTSEPNLDRVKLVNATVRSFETIGTAIRKAYNYGLSVEFGFSETVSGCGYFWLTSCRTMQEIYGSHGPFLGHVSTRTDATAPRDTAVVRRILVVSPWEQCCSRRASGE